MELEAVIRLHSPLTMCFLSCLIKTTPEVSSLGGHRILGILWKFRFIFLSVTRPSTYSSLSVWLDYTFNSYVITWKVTLLQELGKTEKIKSTVMTLEWVYLRSCGATWGIMSKFKIFFIERNSLINKTLINCVLYIRSR